MPKESVSVVIPTWNRQELLQRLLERLSVQSLRPLEVIVVDDGSEDDSAVVAGRMGAAVLRMDRNTGFAKAVNRGIQACRGELIAILNNDVEPKADWLQAMVNGLGEAWFASGKLLDPAHPERLDGAFDEIARSGCACRCGHGARDGAAWNRPRRIRLAPLTAALFRKSVFEQVGLLDERFESYLEDVDFGIRCAVAGLDGVYLPEAVAFHRGSATLGRWHGETVRRLARNQVFLVAKHFPAGWVWRHGWQVLVGQGLWGAIALRHSSAGAWLRGKWEGWLGYRRLRVDGAGRPGRIDPILVEGDKIIRELQRESGLSGYWKLYSSLTGGGASR